MFGYVVTNSADVHEQFLVNVQHGFTEEVSLYLEIYADQKVATKPRSWSTLNDALYQASSAGHLHIVRLLVRQFHTEDVGTFINLGSPRGGRTALHISSEAGRLDVVRYLIRIGADLMAKDQDQCTAAHLACLAGQSEVVRILFDRTLYTKHTRPAREEDRQVDLINARAGVGSTCLHLAAMKDNGDLVTLLLELGANAALEDFMGESAWETAGENCLEAFSAFALKQAYGKSSDWYYRVNPRILLRVGPNHARYGQVENSGDFEHTWFYVPVNMVRDNPRQLA